MDKSNNYFLIGPMAAGKTTIGRQLATVLSLTFYDSDKEIEKRAGADIPWIFDVEGEEGFRKREEKVIEELTSLQNIVLATGGGAILNKASRALLSSRGAVIYLRVSIEAQLQRAAKDRSRPLINPNEPELALRKLAAKRNPLYEMLADYTFDTQNCSVAAIVKQILEAVSGGRVD